MKKIALSPLLCVALTGCDQPRPATAKGQTWVNNWIRVRQVSDDGTVLYDKVVSGLGAWVDSASVRLGDGTLIQGGKITVSPADEPKEAQ